MADNEQLGALIVTGASRGIGAAVARLAGERGYAVAVNFATNEADAKKVVDAIMAGGGRAIAIQADVSREPQIIRMFETAERELGPIKALVNNTGITGGFARVEEVSSATIANVLAVNVTGRILCSRGGAADVDAARRNGRSNRQHFFARGAHRSGGRVGTLRGVEGRDR